MKGSLIIVSFFVVGTLCGLYHLIPSDFIHSKLSYYALCALMFCVGVSIGNDPNTLKSFRSLNPRLVFLPIMTILGTLAGCAVVSLFLSHRSPTDCMAVGAGFGYYSLSSIFITEYKGPELGTIALLSNIIREIIALLCAPLLVRYFGRLAPISAWRTPPPHTAALCAWSAPRTAGCVFCRKCLPQAGASACMPWTRPAGCG